MVYKLSSSEVLFYTKLLCQKYSLNQTDLKELTKLFNEEIEIPITETELFLILDNPEIYEEMRLIINDVT